MFSIAPPFKAGYKQKSAVCAYVCSFSETAEIVFVTNVAKAETFQHSWMVLDTVK